METISLVLLIAAATSVVIPAGFVWYFGGIHASIFRLVLYTCPARLMDQGAEPSGILGAVVLAFMQNMNKGPRSLMQEAASLKPGEAVLELGCADGHALVEIAKRVAARSNNSKPANALQKGAVIGVDPSASAIESAKRLLNSAGPVPGVAAKAVCASVGAADGMIQLPIRENSCDAVLHANCVYFWEDLEAGMTDVFRCLKPGGRQVFVAAPEAVLQRNHKANPVFRNVSHAEYIAALKAAGFVKVRSEAHASDDKYHGGEQGGSDGGPAGE